MDFFRFLFISQVVPVREFSPEDQGGDDSYKKPVNYRGLYPSFPIMIHLQAGLLGLVSTTH